MEMEIKAGDKVKNGMLYGTVDKVHEPQAPHFVRWVSLVNITKKDGTPSKRYKNGLIVQLSSCVKIG